MSTTNIEKQLQDIHQKLDYITEQMRETQRKQKEFQELKNDLAIIGKDIFDAAVEELEDVAPYFDTNDLVHMLKKMLRNTRNINRILTQLEGANDLFNDIRPLGKQVFDELLNKLNELDKKGYFEFLSESVKIVDTVVTSFSVDDLRLLRENITSILLTIKGMTQPDMLSSVNNALQFFKKMDIEVEKDTSYFSILKKLRDPEVKRGFVFMLEFVKSMAASNGNNKPKIKNKK